LALAEIYDGGSRPDAVNLECGSRRLTSTVKICTRTQYVGLAEQCQQTPAGLAMNFGADLALAAQKA
jgi:hypothetical protein